MRYKMQLENIQKHYEQQQQILIKEAMEKITEYENKFRSNEIMDQQALRTLQKR